MLDIEPENNDNPAQTSGESAPSGPPPRRRRAATRQAGPPSAGAEPVRDQTQPGHNQPGHSEPAMTAEAAPTREQAPTEQTPSEQTPGQPESGEAGGSPAAEQDKPAKKATRKRTAKSAEGATRTPRKRTSKKAAAAAASEESGAETLPLDSQATETAPVATGLAETAPVENGLDDAPTDQAAVADDSSEGATGSPEAGSTESASDRAAEDAAAEDPAEEDPAAEDPAAEDVATPDTEAALDEIRLALAAELPPAAPDVDDDQKSADADRPDDADDDESESDDSDSDVNDSDEADPEDAADGDDEAGGNRRRRRRRGGRRRRRGGGGGDADDSARTDAAQQGQGGRGESSEQPSAGRSADAQSNGAQADGARSSDTEADGAQTGDTQTDGAQSDDAQSDGGQSDGAQSDGRQSGRGRGGRSRRRTTGDNDSSTGDSDGENAGAEGDGDSSDDDNEEGGQRRRRRRRRRRGEDSGPAADDPAEVVVRVREPRSRKQAQQEVTGIEGSTRMEAKRQRRREGREAGRRRAPILSEAEFLARREAVVRKMVIRQRDELSQIAVLEDDILVEHYVDRESAASLIGNVYLGRVQNVLPSMEAAFIDIGRGRNAVLYAGEVDWDAFGAGGQHRKVENVLKSGQTVLVQVTKDPVGAKGARLTSHITLPGRYIVYAPGGHLSGISRKLPDNERKRLKSVLNDLVPESASVIVRTAAEGASEDELVRDVNRLKAQWEDIERKVKAGSAPKLLYGEPDLTVRIVRDLFTEDFAELIIQGNGSPADAYEAVDAYVGHVAPHLHDRMRRWDVEADGDLFAQFRLDEQIAKALERKVFLPSGGSLIIDRTEAMTVIDVNTGKFTGSGGNLEATVTSNNLEAAEEVVRQLRLRDIGGIIVIDFIDMVLPSNRELLLRRLVECLGRDRTRHQVAEVTSLGLVQMTRKKIGTGLLEAFTSECEHCHGRGYEISDVPVEAQKQPDGGSRDNRGGGGGGGGGRDRGRGRGNQSGSGSNGNAKPVHQPIPAALRPDRAKQEAVEQTPVEEVPVEQAPVEQTLADQTLAEQTAVEETVTEQLAQVEQQSAPEPVETEPAETEQTDAEPQADDQQQSDTDSPQADNPQAGNPQAGEQQHEAADQPQSS